MWFYENIGVFRLSISANMYSKKIKYPNRLRFSFTVLLQMPEVSTTCPFSCRWVFSKSFRCTYSTTDLEEVVVSKWIIIGIDYRATSRIKGLSPGMNAVCLECIVKMYKLNLHARIELKPISSENICLKRFESIRFSVVWSVWGVPRSKPPAVEVKMCPKEDFSVGRQELSCQDKVRHYVQ